MNWKTYLVVFLHNPLMSVLLSHVTAVGSAMCRAFDFYQLHVCLHLCMRADDIMNGYFGSLAYMCVNIRTTY